VEKELLQAELLYEMELASNRHHLLCEIKLEIENLKRKLNWFAGAIKKYVKK
jgi:hypothetical protein